tara:strand:+ start:327 stop:1043 length:717 start_codon:yes stop_codon:yes gene_type:complete
MKRSLTKSELINLFYGGDEFVLELSHQWMVDAETMQLDPNHYIIERESGQIVNIFELYVELLISESDALKTDLAKCKKHLHGSIKHDYMIAPKEFYCFGEPENRTEPYYFKKLVESDWANTSSYEFARVLAQGDARQTLKTEGLIHHYIDNGQLPAIDEESLKMISSVSISIEEWQRAMVLKDLLYLQKKLFDEVEHNSEIFITDVMPKRFMYGQSIIYNPNKKAFSVNGNWIEIDKI